MPDGDEFDSLASGPVPGIDEAPADGLAPADATTALRAELEKTRAELEEQRNLYLRALADFENYKKRAVREHLALSERGRREILKRLLDIMDSMERAAAFREAGTPPDQLVDGVLATMKQLEALLRTEGVRPLEVAGKEFDPKVSEAVGTRQAEGTPANIVVDEARKGYALGDEVLRPAQVIVSTTPE
jgi:molecular chaperone GrpE